MTQTFDTQLQDDLAADAFGGASLFVEKVHKPCVARDSKANILLTKIMLSWNSKQPSFKGVGFPRKISSPMRTFLWLFRERSLRYMSQLFSTFPLGSLVFLVPFSRGWRNIHPADHRQRLMAEWIRITPLKSNMTGWKKQPFEDVFPSEKWGFPIEHGDFPLSR